MKSPLQAEALILVGALGITLSSCHTGGEASTPQTRDLQATAPVPRAWAHESSDIPVDERISFGHLENGVRWAWAANSHPANRCYLRLHVNAGSLAETEAERGMAHFLEHMAFNGSANFPAGTLIEWFQGHGMAFGADTNAHTNFSETVYKLDLPTSDEETIREGLFVLRDLADGVLFDAGEVEAEKGIIDGEERERDSAMARVFKKRLEIVLPGVRVAERIPIGEKQARDEFTPEGLSDFYKRWYRPENMTLIAVGDLGDQDPSELFGEYFASIPVPSTPLAYEPGPGVADDFGHTFIINEDEVPHVTMQISRLEPWEETPATRAEMISSLPMSYSRRMLNLRFLELAKQESSPFLSAQTVSASTLNVLDGESLKINSTPENWAAALAYCERELRRAIEYGFQSAELEELRAVALRSLDLAVQREPTAHSGIMMSSILSAAEDSTVPVDAATRRAILRPAIEALTLEDCHAALVEAWSKGTLSVSAMGNLDLGDDGELALLAAFEEGTLIPVEAGAVVEELSFAYASSPDDPGLVVKREEIEELEFTRVRFENGVTLNLKRTELQLEQVLIVASIGEGALTIEPERSTLAWVGSTVFAAGGLEEHSSEDLRRLTAGKMVNFRFNVAPDSFELSGTTSPPDLLMQCELMCAYILAPGWREDGLIQLHRKLPLIFEDLKHQHGGPVAQEFIPALFSGSERFIVPPPMDQITSIEMGELRDWLGPQLAEGALELTMVGDLDEEEAISIAARTFGKLPPRLDLREFADRRVVAPPIGGLRQKHEIETEDPKSLVMLAFPVPDGIDPQVRWRFQALQTIINDRLRLEVRERLGAAYSPASSIQLSRTFPGIGLLFIQSMSDPEEVDVMVDACLNVAASLAEHGVTEEEIDRLREPILNRLRDSKRINRFWLSALSKSYREPGQVSEILMRDEFFSSYGADDISPLAAQYLKPELASILIVNPN